MNYNNYPYQQQGVINMPIPKANNQPPAQYPGLYPIVNQGQNMMMGGVYQANPHLLQQAQQQPQPQLQQLGAQYYQQEKVNQINELKQNFPKLRQAPTQIINMQQKDIVTVELPIGSDLVLPLDIIISDRFPQIPPQIKFKKNIIHDSVEPETLLLRVIPWNQSSRLVLLMQTLVSNFMQRPPMLDPLIQESIALKRTWKFEDIQKALISLDYQRLFPKKSASDLYNLQSERSFEEYIVRSKEYLDLVTNLISLIDFNQKLSAELTKKRDQVFKRKAEIEQLSQTFEYKKEVLISKFNQCNMIKERFDKTKVLACVENEINRLEEETSEAFNQGNMGFDNKFHYNINESLRKASVEEQLLNYLENRKK